MSIRIGLLGLGTVGLGFYRLVQSSDLPLTITQVAVRHIEKHIEEIEKDLLTTDPFDVLHSDCDVVVELIGGIDPAYSLVSQALRSGMSVITANKALLAEKGEELFSLATQHQVSLYFEAAVAGCIPIINTLQTHLASDEIRSVEGILNGTSHYILSAMQARQVDFDAALQDAAEKGFAEADPSHDVKLIDATHKLSLLIMLAFKKTVDWKSIHRFGIKQIRYLDMMYAEHLGYEIKPVACARLDEKQNIIAYVAPMLVPQTHVLSSCQGVMNAVTIESEHCDKMAFFGPGAGSMPTATSVFADLMRFYHREPVVLTTEPGHVLTTEETQKPSEFYLRLIVRHEVGILAKLTQLFSDSSINIKAIQQKQFETGLSSDEKLIVILTESVLDQQIAALSKKLEQELHFSKQDKLILRIMEN